MLCKMVPKYLIISRAARTDAFQTFHATPGRYVAEMFPFRISTNADIFTLQVSAHKIRRMRNVTLNTYTVMIYDISGSLSLCV